MDFSLSDIEALARLLTPPQSESREDAVSTSELTRPSPANIGPKELLPVQVAAPKVLGRSDVKPGPSWCDDEDHEDHSREVPEYEFRYKQCVTSSDNFLGLSGKDPSSTCCEELVLVVQLPKTKNAADLQLDTAAMQLRLISPTYKLQLCLPHKVDSDRGTAKWDGKKKTLSITLPIIREDPFA